MKQAKVYKAFPDGKAVLSPDTTEVLLEIFGRKPANVSVDMIRAWCELNKQSAEVKLTNN